MAEILFWVFAVVAVGGALLAVTRRSPLNCALSLVISFVAVAGLYFLLKAPFPGILQILVYAGAIMVLVIFVIMFLNMPEGERSREELSKPGMVAAVFLLVPLAIVLLGVIWGSDLAVAPASPGAGQATAGGVLPAEFGTVKSVGDELFSRWVYPFEVVSILLLVAMVAAVLLAKRRLD